MKLAVILAALVLLRLVLTGERDILAINGPYDEHWYVSTALRGIWGGDYTHMAFAHLPVYPAWLWLVSLVGLPARLAIDLAWLGAASYLAFAVARFTGYRWAGVVLWLILAFDPLAISLFDRALSETLLGVLMAMVTAAALELWNTRDGVARGRRIFAMVALAVSFGLAYHTRKEGIAMLPPMLLLAALALARGREWWAGRGVDRPAIVLVALPLAAALLVGIAIATANAARWGLFATHELGAAGYNRAMKALASIDLGPTPKHVTVTAAMRKAAYEASPAFAQLREFFEGPTGQELARYTAQYSGAPGEIANGWFYWSLRDAAATAGWHRDASTAEARYHAIADELGRAFAEGRLRKRTVVHALVDPDVGKWIGDVAPAWAVEWKLLVMPQPRHLVLPAEDASPGQFEDFVRVAGRRRMPGPTEVAGWVTAPEGSQVELAGAGTAAPQRRLAGPQRPDVAGAFPFRLRAGAEERAARLVVRLPDGRQAQLGLDALQVGKVTSVAALPGVHVGVDALRRPTPESRVGSLFARVTGIPAAAQWHEGLTLLRARIGWLLAAVGIAGLAAALVWRDSARIACTIVLTLLLVTILSRVTLLAILDASSWNGAQARYLFPVLPALAAFGAIGAAFLASAPWRRRAALPPPAVPEVRP